LSPNTRHKPTHAFVCHFIPEPGVDGIKAFRSLLKAASRHYGLRAVHVQECALPAQEDQRALRLPKEDSMSAFSKRIREGTTGFFKASEFEGEKTLTIKHLDEGMEMFDKEIDLLNFIETGRQLQLNQTTSEWLLDNFGDDPEKWKDKKVTLYLGKYKFKDQETGEIKEGPTIRLKLPGAASGDVLPPERNAPARSSASKGNGDMSDDIPF